MVVNSGDLHDRTGKKKNTKQKQIQEYMYSPKVDKVWVSNIKTSSQISKWFRKQIQLVGG